MSGTLPIAPAGARPSEDAGAGPAALAAALAAARSGLRSDVERLLRALEGAELLVPLARRVEGVPVGEQLELSGELQLQPHLLVDDGGGLYCALFSAPETIQHVAAELRWKTSQGDFEYCTLPAAVGLEMLASLLEEPAVKGLVIDAMSPQELLLRPDEVASIASGRALPLVGYVQELAPGGAERTLVGELDQPPPAALTEAIAECLASHAGAARYTLQQTFNPERDTEPHLTLLVHASAADFPGSTLGTALARAVEGKVPPPGYIDIVFDS